MAGADVRAGRAYVELGTKDSAYLKGLAMAMGRLRSFVKEAGELGKRVSLAGFGVAGGIAAVAKSFSDAGVELAKLRKQTGLGADELSGIAQAAKDAEVPVGALAPMLTKLQRLIAAGGKDADEAFSGLGSSTHQIRAMRFADVLSLISDRLPGMADETRRVAIATALFGRSGAEMLPVLEHGSKGLNDATIRARELGTALSDEALDSAEKLDATFDTLSGSLTGLRNAFAQAAAFGLTPMIDGLSTVVRSLGLWIQQNPEAVSQLLNMSIAAGSVGAAVAALSVSFYALTSPIFLSAIAVGGLGAAILSVTDTLGDTKTGFADLFNSIRINGQGLATWFTKFFLLLNTGWKGLDVTVPDITGDLLAAGGDVAAWFMPNNPSDPDRSDRAAGVAATVHNAVDAMQKQSDPKAIALKEELDKKLAELNAADPQDPNADLVGFDTKKAKQGVDNIGRSIGDGIQDIFASVAASFGGAIPTPGASPFANFPPKNPDGSDPTQNAIARLDRARTMDVLGTFNASAAGRIGVGSSLQERAAKAAEDTAKSARDTAKNTRDLLNEIRNGEGSSFQ